MIILYVFIAILGLLIGSFLNVCICRIPENESIIKPPSHCVGCGNTLKPIDLIPVLSYLFLKGKCRYCGAKVSFRYPMVELLTAVIFCVLFSKYFLTFEFLAFAFLMSILIAVFFIDLDHRIIPNGLVITGIIGGIIVIIYNVFNPLEYIFRDANWWNPILGSLVGSGIMLLIALLGMVIYKTDDAMGMGDVKIFFPIGMFLGWRLIIVNLYLAAIIGGAVSLLLIIIKLANRKSTVPFGPFIVTATFITIMWGNDIINWYLGFN